MFLKRALLNKEDAGGSAGGGGDNGAAGEVERYKREAAESKAKLDKIEGDRKKASDAKRAEDEGAKAMLAEKQKEADALNERIKAFEDREGARIDKALKALPEKARARLAGFRDAMSLAKFAELVESESQATTEEPVKSRSNLPPAPGIDNRSARNDKTKQITSDVEELLRDRLGREEALKIAGELTDADGRWSLPGRVFWQKMKARAQGGAELTPENAALRKVRG